MQLPLYKLPVPGDMVGHYRVLEQVGRGGQGHVYKAEYAGRFFALKFFQARPVAPWGEHELDIVRRVEHPNVVRVLGHGRWPDPERGFLYLAMEWVEGLTLEDKARVHGVAAREAATIAMKVADALGAVHAAGVRHRDVKPENILIRESDGEPMLVDFGVAHLEGLSSVEGRGQLVGTKEFYSPQAFDFLWDHYGDGELYRAGVSDEVWALGVTLYWLLTSELPFGSRFTNPSLVRDVRAGTPLAAHERNARLPVTLGEVCMRMLEKEPAARYADMVEVGAALESVLAGAQGEASWDVTLVEPEAPPLPETEKECEPEPLPPAHGVLPEPASTTKPPPVPRASRVPVESTAPERAEDAPAPPVPARSAWRRGLSRLVPTGAEMLPVRAIALDALRRAALVLIPVVVVATVGAWFFMTRTSEPVSAGSAVESVASSPGTLARGSPTPHASVFRDVAIPGSPAEPGTDALPYLPSLPASEFTTAMLRKEESRLKKEEKPTPQRKARRCIPLVQTVCTAGVCTLVLTGCANTPQVIPQPGRPLLKPADCPPGAEETMTQELGIRLGQDAVTRYPIPGELHQQLAVREGPASVELRGGFGKLPDGTQLHGKLLFGPDRVQGRFTEARTPEGRSYSVCMEFAFNGRSGGYLDRYNEPDIAIVRAVNSVYAVSIFGYEP